MVLTYATHSLRDGIVGLLDWRYLVAALAVHRMSLIVYRLFFHPLRHIPGPRLAAVSSLYYAYWQVYNDGILVHHLPELHRKYGPAVRIKPDQIQLHEPDVYHRVFAQKSPFTKDPLFYKLLGTPGSTAGQTDPNIHRAKRALLNPMFSKQAINDASDSIVYKVVEKLCAHLDTFCAQGKPVPLANAFYCVTIDIISTYAFGESWNMLDEPSFESVWVNTVLSLTQGANIAVYLPSVRVVAFALSAVFPSFVLTGFTRFVQTCRSIVERAVSADVAAKASGQYRPRKHKTIADAILNPTESKLHGGPSPYQYNDIVDETILILNAGTDTTANALTYCVWETLKRPDVKSKLLAEIDTVERDQQGRLPLIKLEGLPYLAGFIKEIMRYYHGAPGTLPRIVPEGGLQIPSTGVFIPAGATIGFAAAMIHKDPTVFESPEEFRPERWFGQAGKQLDTWLASFSKGDRQCLGINLAYAELFLVIGNLLSRYEITAWETPDENMEWVDHLVTTPKGKLQVLMKKRAA